MGFFSDVKEAALSKLFPRKCPLCGTILLPNERICGSCSDNLVFIKPPVCRHCGRPCFDCACTEEGFAFDRCVSPFVYTKAARRGMHRLKFHNAPTTADFFAKFMTVAIKREYKGIRIDLVTCVPMHPRDLSKRGYNQAALLAGGVGKALEIPVYNNILVKHRQNAVQHSLTRTDRQKNVEGVFEVNRPYMVSGKTVLLCDDIITTGSTLDECARALKDAGAVMVVCVTAAAVVGSHEQSVKRVYV